jgi:CheY-like chemotaxis protein
MKRHLDPGANPTRVTGRWMPDNPSPRPGLVGTSADERCSPTQAEPGASPGILLAGDATELNAGRERAEARLAERSAGRGIDESPTPPGHPPRLVIADDDPVIRLMLGMSLGDRFDVVGIAADSEEAIELAGAHQPDAALVDVVMPKGGGLRAVHGIHEVAPDTAVVMLSGYRTHGVVGELIQAGAIAYRRKGVPPRVLADALSESIRAHKAERRESAWAILAWYCLGLDRPTRRRRGAGPPASHEQARRRDSR